VVARGTGWGSLPQRRSSAAIGGFVFVDECFTITWASGRPSSPEALSARCTTVVPGMIAGVSPQCRQCRTRGWGWLPDAHDDKWILFAERQVAWGVGVFFLETEFCESFLSTKGAQGCF
jgi:hypothetical protein